MSVYLDFNASSPARQEVVEAMMPHFRELHGNPSSTHYFGQRARAAVEEARNYVASLIEAEPEEIVFISGGTEANNMVLAGVSGLKDGCIVISTIEHPAVYNTVRKLEKAGRVVRYLPVDRNGVIELNTFEQIVSDENVAVVSVMTANNETGALQPIDKVSEICARANVLLHSDAAQAVGKIPFSVKELKVDFATIAAHKMGGPIGIGALFIRSGVELDRLMEGGSQEVNRRPGTESVPLIVGFGEACRIAAERRSDEESRMKALRDRMEAELQNRLSQLIINSAGAPRLPNTSNIAIPGVSAEMLVIRLDLEGYAVSSGSACHSGRTEPSRILTAMGLKDIAASSIRISLGPDTTESEISSFIDTLEHVLDDIKP